MQAGKRGGCENPLGGFEPSGGGIITFEEVRVQMKKNNNPLKRTKGPSYAKDLGPYSFLQEVRRRKKLERRKLHCSLYFTSQVAFDRISVLPGTILRIQTLIII